MDAQRNEMKYKRYVVHLYPCNGIYMFNFHYFETQIVNTQFINIPISLIHENEVVQNELKDWMNENINWLEPAMDLDASTYDERAILCDGPEITKVEVTGNAVIIYYVFYWNAYYGCRDQNHSGKSEEAWFCAELENDILFFEEYFPLDKRSTCAEF